jgi:hypothetical protein
VALRLTAVADIQAMLNDRMNFFGQHALSPGAGVFYPSQEDKAAACAGRGDDHDQLGIAAYRVIHGRHPDLPAGRPAQDPRSADPARRPAHHEDHGCLIGLRPALTGA